MPSYWWKCEICKSTFEFSQVTNSSGIHHFIWDVLVEEDWDQSALLKKCPDCMSLDLRVTYEFPRKDRVELRIKHMIGLTPQDGIYIPMMWETIPDQDDINTWFDFKYVNGRTIYGLNKPAVFTQNNLKEIFRKFLDKTGDKIFL